MNSGNAGSAILYAQSHLCGSPMASIFRYATGLSAFRQYVDRIERLAQGLEAPSPVEWKQRLATCFDGEPGRVLRSSEGDRSWKQQGAYFTGARLANKLAKTVVEGTGRGLTYFDPACGVGDLFLAVARQLPILDTFEGTLADWGRQLAGCDIDAEFVRLAKARLVLLAAQRCHVRPNQQHLTLSGTFPGIVQADFLAQAKRVHRADAIIMNPPFGYTKAPVGCEWASGRVTSAAMFAERAVAEAREGTRIAAILPDVLRAGSRYARWRLAIDARGLVQGERPLGVFDQWADVDVYLLNFQKTNHGRAVSAIQPKPSRVRGVGKRFDVHVGAVVPHRHGQAGPKVSYIHARSLPAWGECTRIEGCRKFSGRLFERPFVAVRRTSSPTDKKRAVATLVLGNGPVAVENHLIVLLPKNASVSACRELMTRLQSNKTDDWINSRLRCRHLTTGVLAGMPWWCKP